jgi:hypothetical protein
MKYSDSIFPYVYELKVSLIHTIIQMFRNEKLNVYLPSLMMKVPDHLYVLGHSYTCHKIIK